MVFWFKSSLPVLRIGRQAVTITRMGIDIFSHANARLIVLVLFCCIHDAVAPDRPVDHVDAVVEHMIITTPIPSVIATAAQAGQAIAGPTDRLPPSELASLTPGPTIAPSHSGQSAAPDLVRGIPSGLRSAVKDRPSSSLGCLTANCSVFYPVGCLECH